MNTAEENMFGGKHGVDFDDGGHKCVKKILIAYGKCIYSIRFVYGEVQGPDVEKDKHGGEGPYEDIITLDYPGEYLTMVSGHYGPVVDGGNVEIRSLTFESNTKTYGPYGNVAEPGIPFSFAEGGAKILGFKGRSDKHLVAIGFHVHASQYEMFMREFKQALLR